MGIGAVVAVRGCAARVAKAERCAPELHPTGTYVRSPIVYGLRRMRRREWSVIHRALRRRAPADIVRPEPGGEIERQVLGPFDYAGEDRLVAAYRDEVALLEQMLDAAR